MKRVIAGSLDVGYFESGPPEGPAVILLHGFPYDAHGYDAVAQRLASAGRRCIVPFLRGYGATRFVAAQTMRSGQQAALGADLLALMDALALPNATLAGYDWGGRAACIVAALWPARVRGLVSGGVGYNIQNIAQAARPDEPDEEYRLWYQWYFNTARGQAGLAANRQALCGLLWRLWSPRWAFDDATYARSAEAFDNPDFVEVVIHSYRHRYGGIAGDPAYDGLEAQLAAQPLIAVPTIVLHGDADGVDPANPSAGRDRRFTGPYEKRIVPGGVGHNIPQEAPAAFAEAILDLP